VVTIFQEGIRMLVLTRKPGERIVIGDDIILTIVRITQNRVRIGIKAPPETPISREEIMATAGVEPASSG